MEDIYVGKLRSYPVYSLYFPISKEFYAGPNDCVLVLLLLACWELGWNPGEGMDVYLL
jgi:hypothetical protein